MLPYNIYPVLNPLSTDLSTYEGPVYTRDTNIEYIGEVVNRLVSRSEINE